MSEDARACSLVSPACSTAYCCVLLPSLIYLACASFRLAFARGSSCLTLLSLLYVSIFFETLLPACNRTRPSTSCSDRYYALSISLWVGAYYVLARTIYIYAQKSEITIDHAAFRLPLYTCPIVRMRTRCIVWARLLIHCYSIFKCTLHFLDNYNFVSPFFKVFNCYTWFFIYLILWGIHSLRIYWSQDFLQIFYLHLYSHTSSLDSSTLHWLMKNTW